jgi:hypothetical protein
MAHVKSRSSLMLAVLMVIFGIALTYYASNGFSGTASFQGGSIVPGGLLPAFVVGLAIFAIGAIELVASVRSS